MAEQVTSDPIETVSITEARQTMRNDTELLYNDPKQVFLHNFWSRLYKGLDYLTLFVYALIVAIGAFLADYILITLLEKFVASAVSKYPTVAIAFDWFQIGSASLTLVAAFVFVFFSALSQMRFAYEVTTGAESQDRDNE